MVALLALLAPRPYHNGLIEALGQELRSRGKLKGLGGSVGADGGTDTADVAASAAKAKAD